MESNESIQPQGETPEVQPEAPAPIQPGTPEYNASMAAYGDAATGNVPQKFVKEDGSVDVESMAKSYMELERMRSGEAPVPVEEPVVEAPIDSPEAVEALATDATQRELESLQIPETAEEEVAADEPNQGMTDADWQSVKEDIWKSGELSESEALKLKARTGWDDTTVKQWALAQRSEVKSALDTAANVVGGQETLSSMLSWASEALPREEQLAINSQLRQPGAAEYVLLGVKARYEAANAAAPRESQEPAATPRRAVTAPTINKTPAGFQSHGEFLAARADVRFGSDSVYRDQIMQRMAETNWGDLPR